MVQINYLILSISLIVWCIVHSVLISNTLISIIKTNTGEYFRFYRISFNLFSLITFIPIIVFSELIKGEYIFIWSGYLQIIQGTILIISLFLFIAGAKQFNGLVFLGIHQIKNSSNHTSLNQSGSLDTGGILGVIRHPWYAATILLLWVRNIDISTCIVNTILSSYLIIGSYLEERKLIIEFGDEYRSYQQNVSMLFPYKWLKLKIIG